MDWATPSNMLMGLLLAVAGGVLGGAVAHWQRGRAFVATGVLIGGVALPLLGLGAFYAGPLAGLVLLVLVAIAAFNTVFG